MNDEPGTASADATAYDLAFTLEERDRPALASIDAAAFAGSVSRRKPAQANRD